MEKSRLVINSIGRKTIKTNIYDPALLNISLHSREKCNVTIKTGYNCYAYILQPNKSITITIQSDESGYLNLESNKNITFRLNSYIINQPIISSLGIYMHGFIGDILLALGYLSEYLKINEHIKDIHIVHGSPHNIYIKNFDIHKCGKNVYIEDSPEMKMYSKKEARILMPKQFSKNFIYFGNPSANSEADFPHINCNSKVRNNWNIPYWFNINQNNYNSKDIAIFRYTPNQNKRKAITENLGNNIIEWCKDLGYNPILFGYDDPYNIPNGIESYIGKLNMVDSIRRISQCYKCITVDSWPATWMPRINRDTYLMINHGTTTVNQLEQKWFHNISTITRAMVENINYKSIETFLNK